MPKKKTLEFRDYLNISIWAFKINWRMSKFVTTVTFVTNIYRNLQSLVNIYIVARIIDQLIAIVNNPNGTITDILPLIIILGLVDLFGNVISYLDRYANRYGRRLSQFFLAEMEYEQIFKLGVQTVQLPNVANKQQIAHDWIYEIREVNNTIVRIVAAIVKALAAGIIVLNISWILVLLLFVASIISFFQSKYFFRKDFEWQTSDKNTQEKRKAWNVQRSLCNPDEMDEISLVGGFPMLSQRFKSFTQYYVRGLERIMRMDSITGFGVDLLGIGLLIYGSIRVFGLAIQRVISIGDTTFYIGAIKNLYDALSWFFFEIVLLRDLISKEKEVYEFFSMSPVVKNGDICLPRLITPPSIEFRNVSFHYPNNNIYIFNNFSLKINSGEKIAIVGENGAGKSTLVKLLCRLYDPQEGQILVNGDDLKNLSIDDWYKNVGVLFQDFNFYPTLSAEENIYIGKSIKKIDREMIVESAKNADAHDFIMKYKKGYQTIMSERFKGGVKPSKGQQQKIAIARFFYRNAPFAIFDEPTSAIDADAEYRIFNRIYNFFDNKTVIIISHRFSTVRNADRILVIKDGEIIEEGSHQELIGNKSVYYSNFSKQAKGYVE
jgi:ATP-binding cassette, subfamily B, bacterial